MKWMSILVVASLGGVAFADDIDDLRNGVDVDFDLVACNYTYTGVQSGSGSVTDAEAPPSQANKAAGTLNMNLDASALFPGATVIIPCIGSKLSPTRVRWTTDSTPNQFVTVVVNGVSLNLKITRIWGQFTGDSSPRDPFFDAVCNQGYNVRLDDTVSNADTWMNVNSQVNGIALLPINLQLRDIDFVGYGGVARGPLYADAMSVEQGALFGGTLASLRFSDNDKVVVLSDENDPNGELVASGASASPAPSSLTVRFEGSSSRTDIGQYLSAYNFATSAWSQIDFTNATIGDQTRTAVLNAPAGTFVQPATRAIRARVVWIPQADIDAGDGWTYAADQLNWISAP